MVDTLAATKYETIIETVPNGNVITYKVVNGTAYHIDTPDEVVRILDEAMKSREDRRLRLFFGDSETGRDWCEEFDVIGYIGRSSGRIKVPLLMRTSRSYSGGVIMDNHIITITEGTVVLYKHARYSLGELVVKKAPTQLKGKGYSHSVYRDGENLANFKSLESANNYISFLKGDRNKI